MRNLLKPAAIAILLFGSIYALAKFRSPQKDPPSPTDGPKSTAPKIQVAVLLDVSNSMDGLIDQAKAQLWNMVSVMGKASCDGVTPSVEIALYEYGRSSNDERKGYVKQITGFTADLDQLSQKLFSLTTNGGDEYCGQVMYNSLTEMKWDTSSSSYKVIFIAGNEDFLQGNLSFGKACTEARNRNVIVNTIYCGDRMQGIREHWNLGSECGMGSFTHINQDAKIDDIPTPYDSTLFVLNDKLNSTYISYGDDGVLSLETQSNVDELNKKMNKSVMAKRVAVKGKKVYSNTSWDMVDANQQDTSFYKKVEMKTLPDSLKTKSRLELKQVIARKAAERTSIQREIESTSAKREVFIAKQKTNSANANKDQTLETEIEKIIRQQASKFNMTIK
ncbi:MAG: hypothetical protein EOP49_23290, partial [Sphingobacteriales bacterium]